MKAYIASTKQLSHKSAQTEFVTVGLDLANMTVHFVGLDKVGPVLIRCQYSKGKL